MEESLNPAARCIHKSGSAVLRGAAFFAARRLTAKRRADLCGAAQQTGGNGGGRQSFRWLAARGMQTPGAILRRVSANGTQLRKEQLGGCLRHSGACRCREPYCEGGTGRDGGSTGAIGKPGKSCCGTRGADRPKRTGIGCGAVLRRASANGTQLRKDQLGECLRHSGACGRRIDAEAMMKRAGRSSAADRGQWRRETELQVAGGAVLLQWRTGGAAAFMREASGHFRVQRRQGTGCRSGTCVCRHRRIKKDCAAG